MSVLSDRYLYRGEDFTPSAPASEKPAIVKVIESKRHTSTDSTRKQPSVISSESYHTYSTLKVCSFFITFGTILGCLSLVLYYLVGSQNSMVGPSSNSPPKFMYLKQHLTSKIVDVISVSSERTRSTSSDYSTAPTTMAKLAKTSANKRYDKSFHSSFTSNIFLKFKKNEKLKGLASDFVVTTENPISTAQERREQDIPSHHHSRLHPSNGVLDPETPHWITHIF